VAQLNGMIGDIGVSLVDAIATGLAVLAAGEIVAAQYFATRVEARTRLIASLLMWEGVAMLACAAVIYYRRDFDAATIVAVIAIWMAGAGIGMVRAGIFDRPAE
jgi:uncharacterized membrane protein HdeD (DUF308 family)